MEHMHAHGASLKISKDIKSDVFRLADPLTEAEAAFLGKAGVTLKQPIFVWQC